MRRVPLLFCLLALTACAGSDGLDEEPDTWKEPRPKPKPDTDTDVADETGDTGTFYGGDTLLKTIVAPHCDGGLLRFGARTQGWTDGKALLNIWEQDAGDGLRWTEEHDLPSVDHGALGWWDEIEQTLQPGAESYERNQSSLFTCDGANIPHGNVYVIRVYDVDGNLADCAILDAGIAGTGIAEVFAGDTDEDVFNPPTRREEITPANCDEWGL